MIQHNAVFPSLAIPVIIQEFFLNRFDIVVFCPKIMEDRNALFGRAFIDIL